MFNKERKERYRKREKTIEKRQKYKKHAQEQNKAKKREQKHTRVRVVELREKVVLCLQVDLRFAFTLFYR